MPIIERRPARSPVPQPGRAAQPSSPRSQLPAHPGNPAPRPHPINPAQPGKESRRRALLSSAATLFAVDGFNRVSIEDLGAAVGVSGPAVYRHFAGKQAVLAALLVSVSQELLDGGRRGGGGCRRPRCRPGPARPVPRRLRAAQARRHPGPGPRPRPSHRRRPGRGPRPPATLRRAVGRRACAASRPATDAAELRLRAQATFGLHQLHPAPQQPWPASVAGIARPLLEEHGARGPAGAATAPPLS